MSRISSSEYKSEYESMARAFYEYKNKYSIDALQYKHRVLPPQIL